MDAFYMMEASVATTSGKTKVEIKSGGKLSEVGKTVLLSNIMKALNFDPDSISDLAIVSVAFEHCKDEKISG